MYYLNKCKPIDEYLVLHEANTDEVYKHINKLKNDSSPGPVDVPNAFLKLLGNSLAHILTNLINRSINAGYMPKPLKVGKQTPVHKQGEICINNYRPITVCSSISKILEKVVRDRVMDYVKRVNILNKFQFGFRSKHNTNHAIINLTEATLDTLEKGLKSGGIYLDVSKAFDTINHNILLRKLEYYGFRANTLMWFESYLKNRLQYVQIRNSKSELYNVEWGIPQGGILAPILFILYTNDIVHSSKLFHYSIYADDTCLNIGIDVNQYDETVKCELEKVVDWFNSNELQLNITKTEYLQFRPFNHKVYIKGEFDLSDLHNTAPQFLFEDPWADPEDPDHYELNRKGEYVLHELSKVCPKYLLKEYIVMPDESEVYEPEYVKYLGVYFDNRLTFNRHIDIVNCKINRIP